MAGSALRIDVDGSREPAQRLGDSGLRRVLAGLPGCLRPRPAVASHVRAGVAGCGVRCGS